MNPTDFEDIKILYFDDEASFGAVNSSYIKLSAEPTDRWKQHFTDEIRRLSSHRIDIAGPHIVIDVAPQVLGEGPHIDALQKAVVYANAGYREHLERLHLRAEEKRKQEDERRAMLSQIREKLKFDS